MKVRRSVGWIVGAVLVSLAGPGIVAAQDRQDVRIATAVTREIKAYPQLSIFDDVNGTVDKGVVTLTGKVTMPYKKTDLGRKAAAVTGVNDVVNRIEVLPVSTFDEELRLRIARAIYGHSNFWRYAAQANPPIHIIVERGHVTLVGVVNNHVDRMLARSLATGLGELSVTNELRTDAEMRSE
jgi:hyperosmotically inducible protein